MKLLWLIEYFPYDGKITGGVESRYYHLMKELLEKDFEICVLTSSRKKERVGEVIEGDGFKIHLCSYNPYSNKGNIWKRLNLAKNFLKYGKTEKNVDIVEGCNFLAYIPAYFVGKKLKIKKIATWHEVWIKDWMKLKGFLTGFFGELWERISLGLKWDKIVSVSETTKNRLVEFGIKKERIHTVYNGINLDKIKSIKIKKDNEFFPRICVVNRLVPSKKTEVVLKAASFLAKKFDLWLDVVGGGAETEKLKELADKLGIRKKTKFYGVLPHEETLKVMKRCHAYVSASMFEGFGITAMEAMACGCVCFLSDIPVFREVGKPALFFKDENELFEAMEKVLNDKELMKKKKEEGIRWVEKFDWKIIGKEYADFLKNHFLP